MSESSSSTQPQHVAIIMDGNGRWAKARGMARTEGHKQGIESVRATIKGLIRLGVPYATFYAFSEQNWKRPSLEVAMLMQLLESFVDAERQRFTEEGIRLKVIGSREKLPSSVLKKLVEVEELTRDNKRLTVQLALSYGGREEITQATREIAQRVMTGELHPDDIEQQTVANHLYTAGVPDPDLLIRTSGEMRLSNFLLWQLSYAEFYMTDTLWPEFDERELEVALEAFSSRNRRFGELSVK